MSNDYDDDTGENIARTLKKILPEAKLIELAPLAEVGVFHVAVPEGTKLEAIDGEKFGARPRNIKTVATMGDADSFIAYVKRHANPSSVVWCQFNPQTYALSFTAVIDEHGKDMPAWRSNVAKYTPLVSAEWATWNAMNKKVMEQVAFAEFIESNEQDIASLPNFPTSLQMLTMATEFEARQDLKVKSVVKLQSGGVRLEYINDADTGTTETMKLFDKFAIGIPVFWSPPGAETVVAYPITARLRYRLQAGKVQFWYELIRPDLVHEKAAQGLLASIRTELGDTPLLLGTST